MRILLLTHAFNSLAQRLYVELVSRAHEVSVELDVNDAVSEEAIALFEPDVVVAPYLKRAIPASIWRRQTCLVVHPGIIGDRGPAALDWAILEGAKRWGVTVLQADATMDGGDVWASVEFPMRDARKSNLYRNEVTQAATEAVLSAIERLRHHHFRPWRLDYSDSRVRGTWRAPMRQSDRAIDWVRDPTETVLRKLRASDGSPGVLDEVAAVPVHLFGAIEEDRLRGRAGAVVARRDGAICRATVDGAVWITHLKPVSPSELPIKLPATRVLRGRLDAVPDIPIGLFREPGRKTYQPIAYEEHDEVGYLHFDFYNGAMATEGCRQLLEAYRVARARDAKVLVLTGGKDFWSNGIDLNRIEADEHPADESWRNINAMDDLCREIIITDDKLVVAAMRGNAGAGGVFLALAADRVIANEGVVLNPHYKNIGNLYGSEYWTYLLPRRVGDARARKIIARRLPMGAPEARYVGLLDELLPGSPQAFLGRVHDRATRLAADPEHARLVAAKRSRRHRDEQLKALECYRAEELERMKLNFYGFDPSYHVARYNFVHKRPHSWTPLHLAAHRRRKQADARPASRVKRTSS